MKLATRASRLVGGWWRDILGVCRNMDVPLPTGDLLDSAAGAAKTGIVVTGLVSKSTLGSTYECIESRGDLAL